MDEQDRRRRIVTAASQTIDEALQERKRRLSQPATEKKTPKPLTETAQLQRQIHLTNLTLNQFEVRLEDGENLNPEEMRVFMSLNDSLRKLTVSLSALKDKADHGKKSDEQMCVEMLHAGMSREKAITLYPQLEVLIDRTIQEMQS